MAEAADSLCWEGSGSCGTENDQQDQSQSQSPTGCSHEPKNVISVATLVVKWDTTETFNRLTAKEKLYAHYMSKAAWYGSLIIPIQTSPESPIIFSVLFDLFKTNTIECVKDIAVNYCFYWEEDWQELLAYTCGIFSNGGNYLGFGDSKFIPGVSKAKLESLISNDQIRFTGFEAREKWEIVKDKVYSMESGEKQLGLWGKGVTTYFTPNCTTRDVALVERFFVAYDRSAINTRVFKHYPNPNPTFINEDNAKTDGANTLYEIRTASVDGAMGFEYSPRYEFGGTEFIITRRDYGPILKDIRFWLSEAKNHAANEHQEEMLLRLIDTFYTGDIEQHKDATRHFLLDKDCNVDAYLGFVETYRDPDEQRGEFEGFVVLDDRALTEKFEMLAENAKHFLSKLPWPAEFEREVFKSPNFSAKEVLAYSASTILDGINVPNYTDIRVKNGFKNFALQKVYKCLYEGAKTPFLSDEDAILYGQYFIPAHDVQLGIHEILGHGSGKLLVRHLDGTTNFPSELLNPVTGTFIDSMYETGESYDSLFPASLGSSMEECRAECVGLYLSLDDEILKVFGYEGEEAEAIKYVNWLDFVYSGTALSLRSYVPDLKQWKEVHEQAKFGILRVLVEAGEGLVAIEEFRDENDELDLRIKLDRSKINTVGRKAIGDFLVKLQVYKATANVQAAQRLYRKITAVSNNGVQQWLTWREIILKKEEPQRLCVQANTVLTKDKKDARLVTYEATFEGFIQSWLERFDDNDADPPSIYDQFDECWNRDKLHFFPKIIQ